MNGSYFCTAQRLFRQFALLPTAFSQVPQKSFLASPPQFSGTDWNRSSRSQMPTAVLFQSPSPILWDRFFRGRGPTAVLLAVLWDQSLAVEECAKLKWAKAWGRAAKREYEVDSKQTKPWRGAFLAFYDIHVLCLQHTSESLLHLHF